MDKWERIQAALRADKVDQVPLALWRHSHRRDRDPETLARATAGFAQEYDLDLVKLTPSGLYAVEDWAVRGQGREGQRTEIMYPGTEIDPPYLARPTVTRPEDYRTLYQHGTAATARELEAIRLTRHLLGTEWPMVMTIFSPLTLAYKLAGERLAEHMRADPEAVHVGLRTLAIVTAAFAHAALDAGADGLFFASQWICSAFCTGEEYEKFGLNYDLEVLDEVSYRSRITILHLHGTDVFFDMAAEYPVDALSWHDRETPPSLAEARQKTDVAFLTGLDRNLLRAGPQKIIAAHVRDTMTQTAGRGLILAPACVIPPETSPAHLQAVVEAVRH
jgi:uroporphyrinogen decarboxylase